MYVQFGLRSFSFLSVFFFNKKRTKTTQVFVCSCECVIACISTHMCFFLFSSQTCMKLL